MTRALDGAQLSLAHHWLALANAALLLFITLPIAAPALMAAGHPNLAAPIYWAYQAVCHQWPFRSFFLFGPEVTYSAHQLVALAGPDQLWTFSGSAATGYKMAFCERDLAIGAAGLAMGLAYVRVRRRLAPPGLLLYVGLLIPIVVDGITQLLALRESTWEFRLATGAIAGAATVWLFFPYFELLADRWLAASAGRARRPAGGRGG